MAPERPSVEMRVLLLAPTARDAQVSRALLSSAGIACFVCQDLAGLCEEMSRGAAAVMVPEEAVLVDTTDCLARAIYQQPMWSDLPVIVLSRSGAESPAVGRALSTLGNVSLIERPVRVTTLMSVIRAALRARERQYQLRDHLEEQQRAQEAVREARDAAEAASRAKDQFLAVLSHELRTPLSPVLMTVVAMQNDPHLPPHLGEDLAMVARNVELEVRLIDDLLDVSRVITGKLRLRMQPVRLHKVLHHALEVCTSELKERDLDVVIDAQASDDCVIGDSARLEQVLWNLLKNAIKFSERGQQISLRTLNLEGGRIRLEIIDRGVGIPQEMQPLLFTAFQQGSASVTHEFGGLGLGLAISKAVIDMHGGSIRAESAGRGRGATFIIELSTVPARAKGLPTAPLSAANGHRPLRVLLVEDHPDTARVTRRLLTASGHTVRTAGSVAAALELAGSETFDIVVSDIGLPDATGYELMEQIRDRHGIKGIALSGYGMDSDMQRARQAGFADHLVKPVNVSQLEAVMQSVANSG